jgi:diguanylate cyclase (GGDEF)-like protein
LTQLYELFPDIAQFCPCVREALRNPADPEKILTANRRLEEIAARIDASAAYTMDLNGTTIAASNWRSDDSFVGKHYHFRPYFKEAVDGRTGRMVALGVTTGELGYYLARPVVDNGQTIGVIVVKLSLDRLEAQLVEAAGRSGYESVVSDADGIIFLSSNPEWQFHTLEPLDAAERLQLQATHRYGDKPLDPLGYEIVGVNSPSSRRVRAPGDSLFAFETFSIRFPHTDWQLETWAPIERQSGLIVGYGAMGLLIGLLVVLFGFLVGIRELYRRQLIQAAIHDPLTGLYTRYYMNQAVPRLLSQRARNDDAHVALILIDLDHFKQVNDSWGHAAGDQVLSDVGTIIREQSRQSGIAVRIGGEELCLFETCQDAKEAMAAAERIRQAVEAHRVRIDDVEIRITLSAGVVLHHPDESLIRLFKRADAALYDAKRAGRNRVVLAAA